MVVGFAANKLKITNESTNLGLSGILMKIALPSTVIMSMQRPFSVELLQNSGVVFIVTILTHFAAVCLGLFLCRIIGIQGRQKGVWLIALAFGNVSAMGFPVIEATLGADALFYVSINNAVFFLLLPTLGVFLIQSKEKSEDLIKSRKFSVNAVFIAAVIGLILFLFSVRIPAALGDALSMADRLTAPLSMIVIGGLLAQSSLKSVFAEIKLSILVMTKLLVIPLLVFFVSRLFISDGMILGVVVYLSAMPSAALVAIYAEHYKSDTASASNAVLMSTLFSPLTIPVISLVFSMS